MVISIERLYLNSLSEAKHPLKLLRFMFSCIYYKYFKKTQFQRVNLFSKEVVSFIKNINLSELSTYAQALKFEYILKKAKGESFKHKLDFAVYITIAFLTFAVFAELIFITFFTLLILLCLKLIELKYFYNQYLLYFDKQFLDLLEEAIASISKQT